MNLIEASSWAEEMNVRVTVCDLDAKIVYMNKAAIEGFQKYGGAQLIGKSLYDCHIPKSCDTIKDLLAKPRDNSYLLNKGDFKRMIHQIPWMENGQHKGIIEFSFDISEVN
jgi:transcriptional regulator with PAS, ATPase and Fis domain